MAGPQAERVVGMGMRGLERFDEPPRPRRDEVAERLEPRRHLIPAVDGAAHLVDERRGEQLLVERPLLMHAVEDLQRVIEGVSLGVLERILPHRGEHPHEVGDLVEPVARQMREAEGGGQIAGRRAGRMGPELAPHLIVRREILFRHPAAGQPAGRAISRPLRIAAVAQDPRGLLGDPAAELVGGRAAGRIFGGGGCHGFGSSRFASAPSGRQRMPRTSASVA